MPAAPTLLTVTTVGSNIRLTWSSVAAATSYRIKYGTTPGVYTTTIEAGLVTTYDISGLNPSTTYYFAVYAYQESDTALYLEMNGTDGGTTFPDSSLAARTVTRVGNVVLDDAESVSGGVSAYFPADGGNGTGGGDHFLSIPASNDFAGTKFQNGFTLECYFKPENNNAGYSTFFGWVQNAFSYISFQWARDEGNITITDRGKLIFSFRSGAPAGTTIRSTTQFAPSGGMDKISIQKSGDNYTFKVNDVQLGAVVVNIATNYPGNTNTNLSINSNVEGDPNLAIQGWLDEMKVLFYINAESVASNEITGILDVTAPTITPRITDGQFIIGTECTICALIADAVGIEQVQIIIDSTTLLTTDLNGLLSSIVCVTFDSTQFSNGEHTIQFIAEDAAGNSTTVEVVINISNRYSPQFTGDFPKDKGRQRECAVCGFWYPEKDYRINFKDGRWVCRKDDDSLTDAQRAEQLNWR